MVELDLKQTIPKQFAQLKTLVEKRPNYCEFQIIGPKTFFAFEPLLLREVEAYLMHGLADEIMQGNGKKIAANCLACTPYPDYDFSGALLEFAVKWPAAAQDYAKVTIGLAGNYLPPEATALGRAVMDGIIEVEVGLDEMAEIIIATRWDDDDRPFAQILRDEYEADSYYWRHKIVRQIILNYF